MKRLFLILCWGFLPYVAISQTVISGKILSKIDSEALLGLNIVLLHKNIIVAYTFTENDGSFTLKYNKEADSLVVKVSGFTIKEKLVNITSKSQSLTIYVEYAPLHLQEVYVKANAFSRKSDTLTYFVAQYKDETDRAIGDVLKKLPGITVEKTGKVYYNGQAINKFYIEGGDLLGSRYGIATNNIQAGDIASVEIYERHQPIQVLGDLEFTDQAAINLKLKKSAIGAWNAIAQLGGGYKPAMWNAELLAMLFARKLQTLISYKTNNEGDDVLVKELSIFDRAERENELPALLKVRSAGAAPIDNARTLYNHAHAVSANSLFKLKESLDFMAKIDYINDYQTSDSYSESVYYFENKDPLTIRENISSDASIHKVYADFTLRNNSKRHYLNETLKLNGLFNADGGSVLGASGFIDQQLQSKNRSIENNFQNIVRLGDHLIKIKSDLYYGSVSSDLQILRHSSDRLISSCF